ncbi:uncharacterized protein LOC143010565 [Genypterus blacodes]|uniref:uncharacterized protein LOC143010565 n=1 Tax=Genypterus blacodes TaxID=154954 RepID=UPI003F76F751
MRQAAEVRRDEGVTDKDNGEMDEEQPASAKPEELQVELPSLSKDLLIARRRKKTRQNTNQALDEFTSDVLMFDMDDFITVDEVGGDGEDAACSSKHRESASGKTEGEDASPAARHITNNSASSSLSSSSKEKELRQVSPVASVTSNLANTASGSLSPVAAAANTIKSDHQESEVTQRDHQGQQDNIPASTECFRAFTKASAEEENHNSQISNENQTPKYGNTKNIVKEPQWRFEVLDSINQAATDSQSTSLPLTGLRETPSGQKADEEEGAHQIGHSDLPIATQEKMRRRSLPTTSAAKDTRTDKEGAKEMVLIDEVQDAATTTEGSGPGGAIRKQEDKTTLKAPQVSEDEEATYEILDSLEDKDVADEPVTARRSTRGRRERTMNESEKEKTKTSQKVDTPTGKRQTPARDSKERNRDKMNDYKMTLTRRKVEEEQKEATYRILDSAIETTGRRGRPKTEGKTTKKVSTVEDETVAVNLSPTGQPEKKRPNRKDETVQKTSEMAEIQEEEEESEYEIIDCLEEDQVQENRTTSEESGRASREEGTAARADTTTSDDAMEVSQGVAVEEEEAKQINVTAGTQGYQDNKTVVEPASQDKAREERTSSRRKTDSETAERELVTLDEILDGEGEAGTSVLELRPHSQEDQSAETLAPAVDADMEEEQRGIFTSAKHKHGNDDKEEKVRFLIVDEVEEKEEEEELAAAEAPPPTSLCCFSSSLVKTLSVSSSNSQPENQTDLVGQQPELPYKQEVEGGVEEREEEGGSGAAVKVDGKRRTEAVGPEAKRARLWSPAGPADCKLPPFRPNNPLGLEFVVPKCGFFCNVCSEFYMAENITKELHCSSQSHYSHLEKHYKELKQRSPQSCSRPCPPT